MLDTICDDTWNMLNMEHITPNAKRWDYLDIHNGGTENIKGPAHMVQGDHDLRKKPIPHSLFSTKTFSEPMLAYN